MNDLSLAFTRQTTLECRPVTMSDAFRQALEALVITRGQSAVQLASAADISSATISRLLDGSRNPSFPMLETLRNVFDVEPVELFTPRYVDVDGRLIDIPAGEGTAKAHTGIQPGTCNRYRTALQSFYTVLNGRSGANPVRDVPRMREPELPPRRIDYATFDALLAAMPDGGQRTAGASPTAISQTKARLRVIAMTGLPHAQLAQLRPEHLVASERLLYVHGRHKGAGTGTVWLPLSARGLEAVQGLFTAKATGPFSRGAMRISFLRAARKIGRPDLRPYDLRHLFGQTVLRLTGNRAATRDLMLHRSDRTTARYVAAEIPGELRAALVQFDAEVGSDDGRTATPGNPPERRLSGGV